MLTKKHMITPNAKTTYQQCAMDATNKLKQLFTRSITAEIEKKFGTLLNP